MGNRLDLATLLLPILVTASFAITASSYAQSQRNEFGPPGPPISAPIPEDDPAAIAKQLGLVESAKSAREMIPGWQKPKKIVVFVDNNTNRLAWFQEVAPGVKLVPVHTRAEAMVQIVGADAEIGNSCSKELILAGGSTLKYFHDYHAGVENCFLGDMPAVLKNSAVVVTNTQRVLGSSVAYHAIAMMVTLSRGLDLYVRMNKDGHFNPGGVPPERLWELDGRTLLVAGLGGIGTEMARMAHALGMHVIATKANDRNHPDFVDYVGLANELPDMIGKADVVMSALPLTPETTGLFDAAMFARMKKGAIFINVTRGKEVVTADLIDALKSGQVGGAGLDATDPDRLPDNDPLFNAPNVILTPHMASQAIDAEAGLGGQLTWDVARENLRRYVNGDKLYSMVVPERGY